MRILILFLLGLTTSAFGPQESVRVVQPRSPLSSFSAEWDKPEYQVCNTATNVEYLSEQEKNVIYILNLARMNPSLFAKTVVKAYPDYSGNSRLVSSEYFTGLLRFLEKKQSMPLLYPERTLFESARCHAESSGESGYIGHNRRTKACRDLQTFMGECCQYGYRDPLSIVMDLLIDEGVPSLGHRIILFKPHTQIGVSIQPHKKYRWNAVLDLG